MKLPLHIGDTKDVALVIHLNKEAVDWLCNELPQGDRFTREIHEAARHIDTISSQQEAHR